MKSRQGRRNDAEDEAEEMNASRHNAESDQSMQRGDDELGKEYLAFIEHRNKVLEEKLAANTALLLKTKLRQDSELQALSEKLKQLLKQRDDALKK